MFTSKLSDRTDWFDLWFEDKKCVINTMLRNMTSDLDNGYDYFGATIRREREEIESYKEQFDREVESFKAMDEKSVNRWCFYDMKRRGVIE